MNERSRLLVKDVVAYGVGEAVVKLIAFVAVPVYTRVFGPGDFGEYAYVGTIAALAAALLIVGGDSAYARFYFAAKSEREKQTVTTSAISVVIVLSAGGSVVLALLAGPIAAGSFGSPEAGLVFALAFLAIPFAISNRLLGQALRNSFRPWSYAALNVFGAALSVALPLTGVLVFRAGLPGLFLGALVAEVIQVPIRLWSVRSLLGPHVSRTAVWKLLRFGLPLVPTSLAYWIFLLSDRAVLLKLSGLEQVGLYAVATTLVGAASTAISAVGQAWTPHATSAFEAADTEARQLVRSVTPYLIAGFGLLSIALTAFASEAVDVLGGANFASAAVLVAPLALGMICQATTTVTALGISLRYRTGYLAVVAWIAALLNVGLNLVLDVPFGAAGAAWSTAASYAVLTLLYLAISQRLWHVEFDNGRTIRGLVIAIVGTVAAALLPTGGPLELVVKAGYSALAAGMFIAAGVVEISAFARPMRWTA